jgi:hypothetical protein
MIVDMVKMRADQELVYERREASYDTETDRYRLSRGEAVGEIAAEQKWDGAYASLAECFSSVWDYANFNGWAETHLNKKT